jgi:hypothetical protein
VDAVAASRRKIDDLCAEKSLSEFRWIDRRMGLRRGVSYGSGKKATCERIGVAWRNDDGSLYVKLSGTQVVSALTLYEPEANTREDAAPAGNREGLRKRFPNGRAG